jgi:hypothetical protein
MSSANKNQTKKVVSIREWCPSSVRYMTPKITDKGSKSIIILSTQTGKGLTLSSPQMTTWGIGEFINEKGESDGKYTMSLNFPSDEYADPKTTEFLEKLKDFENQILDDAVKNSELWWGEEMSREVVKHTFFPMLKYSKNKETKKVDYTKAPTLRCKIPYYDEKWNMEIFSPSQELLFPSTTNPDSTPLDYIPKLSKVMCVIQCGGIWIGGKGWGITWKTTQCVVEPRESDEPTPGKCQIPLDYLNECMPSSITSTPPTTATTRTSTPPTTATTRTSTPDTPKTPETPSINENVSISKTFIDDEEDDDAPTPTQEPTPDVSATIPDDNEMTTETEEPTPTPKPKTIVSKPKTTIVSKPKTTETKSAEKTEDVALAVETTTPKKIVTKKTVK